MTKKINILLADDDIDDRQFFDMALQEIPLSTQLKTVENGQRLMEFLKDNESELPFAIFLDINMPRKTGSECLVAIKNDQRLKHIPIIMYSTSLHYDVVDLLYENGAHYYLQKPGVLELSKAINKILLALMENPQRPSRKSFVVKDW